MSTPCTPFFDPPMDIILNRTCMERVWYTSKEAKRINVLKIELTNLCMLICFINGSIRDIPSWALSVVW